MTRTNISLPLELKAKAKRNGKHRGIKALSTYIQYLIEADDHLIQDAKMGLVSEGRPRINYSDLPPLTLNDYRITEDYMIEMMSKDENINFIYRVNNRGSYSAFQTPQNEKTFVLVWERQVPTKAQVAEMERAFKC